jgi:spore germination protein PB
MNFYIQQSIHIHYIKIGGVTNSSVLQIGSAGIIKPSSHLYNTGGFTKPAPVASDIITTDLLQSPQVPLTSTS